MSSCCGPKEEEIKHDHCSPVDKADWWLRLSAGTVLISYVLHLLGVPLPTVMGADYLGNFVHHCYQLLNEMWIGILIGGVAVGILHFVPSSSVQRLMGNGNSFGGVLRATAAGVALDLCSHGILMVGLKLYNKGLSLGQTMAFLIASPWNSFSLTIILISLIGLPWTLAFIVLSMLIAVISGLVFNWLVKIGKLPDNPVQFESLNSANEKGFLDSLPKTVKGFLKDVVWHGIKDSKSIIKWLFIGIVLASALREVLSPEQYQQYFGNSNFGLAMTIVFATILEVCSEGSAPIASDIFLRAKSPGNAFAFMMAGVSTDYTEIMSIREKMGSWKIALALPLITLPQIIFIAWLIQNYA